MRRFGFTVMLVLVFLRFTTLPELLAYKTGRQLYLLYTFVPLAWLALLMTHGAGRALRHKATLFWVGFVVWMILATPFSQWPGGSIDTIVSYLKADFPMVLFIAGLTFTWKECVKLLYAIGAGSLAITLASRWIATDEDYRVALSFGGTVANSNDVAAHLILTLPFVLILVMRSQTPKLIRLAGVGVIAWGLYSILGTASRGALIGLACAIVLLFLKLRTTAKIGLLVAVPLIAVGLVALLPQKTLLRLTTFSTELEGGQALSQEEFATSSEAADSAAARSYLLKQSLLFTLRYPVFGVGPGEFSIAEGGLRTSEGKRGSWHETHNTYTQISSENGVPGLVLFLCALAATFKLLRSTEKKVRQYPQLREIELVVTVLIVGLTSYCITTLFLSHGYKYYQPALTGLAIAIYMAAQREISKITLEGNPLSKLAPRPTLFPATARIPQVVIPATPNPAGPKMGHPRKGFAHSQRAVQPRDVFR